MDLIKTCGDMTATTISTGCTTDAKVGYPVFAIYGAKGDEITAVGDIPTPAEVQNYLNLGTSFIIPLTNGTWIEPEKDELTGADTNGQTIVTEERNGITGSFRQVNNSTLEMFAQNNLNNQEAQLWVIDSNNLFHGAKKGFYIPFYISNFSHAGHGQSALIAISNKWKRKETVFNPISVVDTAYSELVNYISDVVYQETIVTTYVLGQVTGYNEITGWDKITHPTIYVKIESNVISFYPTASDRTGGTNVLATCDTGSLPLTVVEANTSGWGGTLNQVSNAIVDNSEWNVAVII